MGITLHLEDTLAEELRQEASEEQISPEELAQQLVRDALQQRVAAQRWQSRNPRRLELIAQRIHRALNPQEQNELEQLQSLAYQMAAPFDTMLMQTVSDLRREIEQLPDQPNP